MRPREAEDPARPTCRPTTSASPPAWATRRPRNIIVLPVVFEGQVKAVLELASFERLQPDAPGVPRPAHRDRSASCSTRSKPTCGRRTCSSSRSRWPSELQSRQEELQQTNQELQEKARLLAHQNEEVERKNQRSRAGPPGAGRKGQAARPDLEVQVRVPGQHVARAAHAAQQPAHPLRPAVARTPTAT